MPASVEIQAPGGVQYGLVTIAATNTAEQLSATSQVLHKGVTIKAGVSNNGVVYVGGDSSVTASNGFPLNGGDSVGVGIDNINKIWVYGTQNDTVAYLSN